MVGNKQSSYINYTQKNLDSLGKLNFFNLNRFAIDHKHPELNNYSMEGQLSYNLNSWFGLSLGASFEGNLLMPSLGFSLSHINKKQDFLLAAYPMVQLADQKSFNFSGFLVYVPKFNASWGLFSQLIFNSNLGLEKSEIQPKRNIMGIFTGHNYSIQFLRLGFNYNQTFQFGLGVDLFQFSKRLGTLANLGVFVRYEIR